MGSPSIDGFSHVLIYVRDIPASMAWYERALGLTELRRDPEGSYVTLQSPTGGFRVILAAGERAGVPGSVDHIAFTISDLAALTAWGEHLAAIGIKHDGIERNLAGHSVDLFDPDGNNIELTCEA